MRTNELRAQLTDVLAPLKNAFKLKEVAYRHAEDTKMFPHVTWEIVAVDVTDMNRRDYTVDIDIYTEDDQVTAMDIADAVEDLFNNANMPEDPILPTYFLITRQSVEDTDKHIKHEVIRVQAQLYEA